MLGQRVRIAVLLAIVGAARSQTADWVALSTNATQLAKQGKYAEAIPVALKALRGIDSDARLANATPPDVSAELTQLGELLLELDANAKAESVFAKAFAIDTKLHGAQDASAASDMRHGGRAYLGDGKNIEAERLFRRALNIDMQAFGEGSAEAARDKGYLMEALTAQGRLGEAWPLLDGALATMVKKFGADSPDVAQFIVQMGRLYQRSGRPWDAGKAYEAAAAIDEKKLGAGHPAAARIRGDYAGALAEQGKYEEAEAELRNAIDATLKAFGPDHPQRARLMGDLGVLQLEDGGNQQSACITLRDAALIMGKTIGKEHPDYASVNRHLGECFRLNHDLPTAVKLLNESMAIDTRVFGAEHPEVAEDNALLGDAARDEAQFQVAEKYYARALEIDEKVLGAMHPKTRAIEMKAAVNYFAGKQPDKAEPAFDRCIEGVFDDLRNRSSYMSEGDRLRFLKTVRNVIPAFFYFVYRYPDRPGLVGKMYNLALLERGSAATSAGAIRAQILASGDSGMKARFDALTQKKQELAALQSSPEGDPAAFRARVDTLTKEVNQLEEGLAYYSPAFASKAGLTSVTWRDVQKALQPGAAAIEYLRFTVTDGRAARAFYLALVLRKDAAGPKLIPLGEATSLNNALRSAYQSQQGLTRGVSTAPKTLPAASGSGVSGTKDAYVAFWKPIEPAMSGVARIYIAADGLLNQFPIGLFSDENGKCLFEKYDLRLVNSTKDLVEAAPVLTARTAVLMGNPSFDLSESQQRIALAKLNTGTLSAATEPETSSAAASRGINVTGGKLNALPATQTEVDGIARQLAAAGWQVKSFTGDLALEESLMAQKRPRLVHLATHGFFLPDQPFVKLTEKGVKQLIKIDDPMLRSGLFFAGANRAQAGAPQAKGLEDGILTSSEATQLDLQGTELVVLSACETGLGDQENGEGVFGLRRALQEAGAQSVMMSMWSVPDQETQELMTLFYKKWLAGADKQSALRQAQLEEREVVRKRYGKDLPFYWGAFVLVGR